MFCTMKKDRVCQAFQLSQRVYKLIIDNSAPTEDSFERKSGVVYHVEKTQQLRWSGDHEIGS